MSHLIRSLFLNLTSAPDASALQTAYRFGTQFTERMTPQQATDYEQTHVRHQQMFAGVDAHTRTQEG